MHFHSALLSVTVTNLNMTSRQKPSTHTHAEGVRVLLRPMPLNNSTLLEPGFAWNASLGLGVYRWYSAWQHYGTNEPRTSNTDYQELYPASAHHASVHHL